MKLKNLTLKPAALVKLASYILITFAIISCASNAGDDSESATESLPEEKNLVDVILLERGDFTREIISNGKLSAIQKAELYFKNPGIIESISYRNGQTAQKGSELARLQNDEYRFKLEKAEVTMEKAEIDRIDALLSMGYKEIANTIPDEHKRIANIRSGYNQAKIQLEEVRQQLHDATLEAPFTGKVEGIKQKTFEKTNSSKPFCTLINDGRFTIGFPLLETEIGLVQTGQKVTVTPVAGANETTGQLRKLWNRLI